MQGLVCQCCDTLTNEFTILNCDHVLCTECLWQEMKIAVNGVNMIRCPCGTITTFDSKSAQSSAKVTANISPRKPNGKYLKTETVDSSSRVSSSAYYRNPNTQTLKSSANHSKRSSLTRRMREFGVGRVSSPRQIIEERQSQCKESELATQLQFLGLQFRKSLEELQRNYNRMVEHMKTKYQNLVRNIKLYWFEEMMEVQPAPVLDLPKLLMKKYNKAIGTTISRINDTLINSLAAFRVDTQPESVSCPKHRPKSTDKQNRFTFNRAAEEKAVLMRTIEEMKQESKLRKCRRGQPQKYRFV